MLDLNAAWRASQRLTFFALVKNATNTRYDTYGGFGPVDEVPWPNIPGGVTDPRTASPGQPLSAFAGARLDFVKRGSPRAESTPIQARLEQKEN